MEMIHFFFNRFKICTTLMMFFLFIVLFLSFWSRWKMFMVSFWKLSDKFIAYKVHALPFKKGKREGR